MTNDHNRYIGLCLPYAFGKLNLRTTRFFEQHLKSGCAICNKELAEIYEAMSLLPLALPQKSAPSGLRNRVLSAARSAKTAPEPERTRGERRIEQRTQPAPVTMRQVAPSVSRPWFGYAIAVAAVLIVVALGWYTTSLIDRLDEQEQQIIALTNDVQAKEELLKVLQAPRIDMVFMNGTNPANPTGYGKIIWDPQKKVAIFQVANLPTVPADKDYQLWVIKNNTPVSAGVFAVEDEKAQENYFKVLSLNITGRSDFDALAVTLEPKGGLPQPSGQVYLISESSPK
ncbi:MAG: anti-sigma factor [Ignavibacteriae bacterium]|nr:anti-sigma factor [Ignavibacteriota bacterium]